MKPNIVAFAMLLALPGLAAAQGLTPSCQADMDKHAQAREKAVERLNALSKQKNRTATKACGEFRQLIGVEGSMLKWMTDNQEWCRLPEAFVDQFKQAAGQTQKVRSQVCSMAAKEQKMLREGGSGGQQRGPAVGGGVQLPKGAL